MAFQPQVNPQTSTTLPNVSAETRHASVSPSCSDYLLSSLHSAIVAGICLPPPGVGLTAPWRHANVQ